MGQRVHDAPSQLALEIAQHNQAHKGHECNIEAGRRQVGTVHLGQGELGHDQPVATRHRRHTSQHPGPTGAKNQRILTGYAALHDFQVSHVLLPSHPLRMGVAQQRPVPVNDKHLGRAFLAGLVRHRFLQRTQAQFAYQQTAILERPGHINRRLTGVQRDKRGRDDNVRLALTCLKVGLARHIYPQVARVRRGQLDHHAVFVQAIKDVKVAISGPCGLHIGRLVPRRCRPGRPLRRFCLGHTGDSVQHAPGVIQIIVGPAGQRAGQRLLLNLQVAFTHIGQQPDGHCAQNQPRGKQPPHQQPH